MAHSEDERKAIGKHLSAARNLAGYTIASAAAKMTSMGYPLTKGALGHWETGRNVPDAIWLSRLARLYETTMDALVYDESVTMDAMRMAAQFDSLTEHQKKTLRTIWMAFISEATSDQAVEEKMPITKASSVSK